MRTINGDLITLAENGLFDVIVHGCNCFHAMGAGIAAAIAARYPAALEADRATPFGDRAKLGTFSSVEVAHGRHRFTIVNCYTQFHWQGDGALVDYTALETGFRAIAAAFPNARIGYPKIGAGLARGDWARIASLIDTCLQGLDHALVCLPRPTPPKGHS